MISISMVVLLGMIFLLLLFLLSMVWPPDSPWSPWWRTNRKIAKIICKEINISNNDVIYDLGCGDGVVLSTAAKEYGACGVGVDIDPLRVLIAKLRMRLEGVNRKVKINRGDLFTTDITSATVVIVYLVPKALNRLETKIKSELPPGAKVVSYVYRIPYLQLVSEDKINKVYVYRISN